MRANILRLVIFSYNKIQKLGPLFHTALAI